MKKIEANGSASLLQLQPDRRILLPEIRNFIVDDYFYPEGVSKAGLRVCFRNGKLEKNFLDTSEHRHGPFLLPTELKSYRLEEMSLDWPIIQALGGHHAALISFPQFVVAFAQQPNGEEGPLLTNGRAVVAYVRGTSNGLHVLMGRWHRDESAWGFGEIRPKDLARFPWISGCQVISP